MKFDNVLFFYYVYSYLFFESNKASCQWVTFSSQIQTSTWYQSGFSGSRVAKLPSTRRHVQHTVSRQIWRVKATRRPHVTGSSPDLFQQLCRLLLNTFHALSFGFGKLFVPALAFSFSNPLTKYYLLFWTVLVDNQWISM